jgi:hypothetical protein
LASFPDDQKGDIVDPSEIPDSNPLGPPPEAEGDPVEDTISEDDGGPGPDRDDRE